MTSRLAEEATYEVRIRGRLDEHWSDWLDGVTIAIGGDEDGGDITILTGQFDQSRLRGLLTRVWDLNLTVVSVALLNEASDGRQQPLLAGPQQGSESPCFSDPRQAQTEQGFIDRHHFYESTVAGIGLSIAAAVVLALTNAPLIDVA